MGLNSVKLVLAWEDRCLTRKFKQQSVKKIQKEATTCIALCVLLSGCLTSATAQGLLISGIAGTEVSPYGSTGESIALLVPANINLNGISDAVDFNIAVADGNQINVAPVSGTFLLIDVAYDGAGNSGLAFTGAMNVSFTGLEGTAPIFIDGASVGNGYLSLNLDAYPTASFSFTSIQFSLPVTGTGNNVNYPVITDTLNIQHGGTLSATPEPSTLALFVIGGLSGLLFSSVAVRAASRRWLSFLR
jgi:hypothetical protein